MSLKKTSTSKSAKEKTVDKKTTAKARSVKKKTKSESLSSAKKKIVVRHVEPLESKSETPKVVGRVQHTERSVPTDHHQKHEYIHAASGERVEKTGKVEVRRYDLDDKIDFKNLHPKSYHIYRKLAFSFLVFTSLLLVAVLYLYYVKVDISLVLNKQHVSGDAVVRITNEAMASSTSSDLPGVVKEIDLNQSKEFAATGKQVEGSDVTGRVRVVNKYVRNQPLVASTRLLSADNQLVRVKQTVNVPAGGSVEVEVFTTEATSSVNIPAGTKLTIPGLWQGIQDKIYAESVTPITYQEKIKRIITEADIESAKSSMRQELESKAGTEVLDAYRAQYPQVLYKIDNDSYVFTSGAKAGEAKDSFTGKASARISVVAFDGELAKKQAQDQLMAQLPADKVLAEFDQSINYELGMIDQLSGTASVNLSYSAEVVNKSKNVIDRSKIVGLTVSQLESFIKNLKDENNNPIVDSYKITFTPSFIGRVPNWPDRINIDPTSN